MSKKTIALAALLLLVCTSLSISAEDIEVEVNVDNAANYITINGTVTGGGSTMVAYIEDPNKALYYVGDAPIIDEEFEFHFRIVQTIDGTYTLTLKSEGMSAPYVTTFEYENIIGESFEVDEGQTLNCVLSGKSLMSFEDKEFTITYSSELLQIVDLCALTPATDTGTGVIPGTDITITSIEPGVITFTKNAEIPDGQVWTGVLNVVKFEAIASDTATVSIQ